MRYLFLIFILIFQRWILYYFHFLFFWSYYYIQSITFFILPIIISRHFQRKLFSPYEYNFQIDPTAAKKTSSQKNENPIYQKT